MIRHVVHDLLMYQITPWILIKKQQKPGPLILRAWMVYDLPLFFASLIGFDQLVQPAIFDKLAKLILLTAAFEREPFAASPAVSLKGISFYTSIRPVFRSCG